MNDEDGNVSGDSRVTLSDQDENLEMLRKKALGELNQGNNIGREILSGKVA